jgi:hypothetical protein
VGANCNFDVSRFTWMAGLFSNVASERDLFDTAVNSGFFEGL